MVSKLQEDGTVTPDTESNIQREIMMNGSVSFVTEMFEDFHKYKTGKTQRNRVSHTLRHTPLKKRNGLTVKQFPASAIFFRIKDCAVFTVRCFKVSMSFFCTNHADDTFIENWKLKRRTSAKLLCTCTGDYYPLRYYSDPKTSIQTRIPPLCILFKNIQRIIVMSSDFT